MMAAACPSVGGGKNNIYSVPLRNDTAHTGYKNNEYPQVHTGSVKTQQ